LTYKDIPLAPAQMTPGEILLEEFLKPLGISQTKLARRMNTDSMRINLIVRGNRVVTAETAILLGAVLETIAQFWLRLQNDHDLSVAALEMGSREIG
jgi:antitoxin HigA-1